MTGPSDEAIEAARALLDERTGRMTNVELLREGFDVAYPIIRADVIAEVGAEVERLRAKTVEYVATTGGRRFSFHVVDHGTSLTVYVHDDDASCVERLREAHWHLAEALRRIEQGEPNPAHVAAAALANDAPGSQLSAMPPTSSSGSSETDD